MKNSLVSVVIPTFNNARYLYEALRSVKAQSYPAIEIIVVDDGSDDNTREVVKGFAAKYVYQEQAGAPKARSRGSELATGRLLAFLDADDIWYSDKLQLQVDFLEQNSDFNMVFGHLEEFISPDCIATESCRAKSYTPGYVPGTMLTTMNAFHEAGGFSDQSREAEFIDWFIESGRKGLNAKLLPDIVLRRRLHQTVEGVRPRVAIPIASTRTGQQTVFKASPQHASSR